MRTIVHMDMDAFFAAIEVLDNPSLAGKPVIVGGPKDSRRGVVATCSYEARRYGVRSAMPIQQAAQLCPDGIFLSGRMQRYREVSSLVYEVLESFSPVIEPLSIDEAFLDMSGCEHFYSDAGEMGRTVKSRIQGGTGLICSVGIAPNKFLAKLASDLRKPDGLVVVSPDEIDHLLLDLPVTKLWGVGAKSGEMLARHGIHRVSDLRTRSLEWLRTNFGKAGDSLYRLSRGIDDRPVEPPMEAKSIGHETTFPEDIADPGRIRAVLAELVAHVGRRLRRDTRTARSVILKVRYADFETLTRSRSVPHPFRDDDTLFAVASDLLSKVPHRMPLRLLGVYVSDFCEARQSSLFEDPRLETVSTLLDSINGRYAKQIVARGRELRGGDNIPGNNRSVP